MDNLAQAFSVQDTYFIKVNKFVDVLEGWYKIPSKKALEYFCRLVTVNRLELVSINTLGNDSLNEFEDFCIDRGDAINSVSMALIHNDVFHEATILSIPLSEPLKNVAKAFSEAKELIASSLENVGKLKKIDQLPKLSEQEYLGDLFICRPQAFRVFKELGLKKPYPWFYPFDFRKNGLQKDIEKILGVKYSKHQFIREFLEGGFDNVLDKFACSDEVLIQKTTELEKEKETGFLDDEPEIKFGKAETLRGWILWKAEKDKIQTNEYPSTFSSDCIEKAKNAGYTSPESAVKKAFQYLKFVSVRTKKRVLKEPKKN